MDTFETKSPDQSVANDLQEQVQTLRHLLGSVLVLVIVVSGTLNVFFLRQLRDARRELTRIGPAASQMMANYQKSEAPMMQTLVNRFTEYGRTHPDYAPILAKYGLKGSAAAPTLAPSTAIPEKK